MKTKPAAEAKGPALNAVASATALSLKVKRKARPGTIVGVADLFVM